MRRARVRHFVYMEIIRGCQMETITSRENAKIKYACRLREEEKLRTADGLFFAEGPKLCLELARGCTLQTLYATEKALAHTPELEAFAGKTVLVTEPVAQKLSGTKTSQDVFGVFEHPGWLALDLVLICGAFATAYFLASDIDYYMERIRYVDPVSDAETVCATAAVLLVLEATRRVAGLPGPFGWEEPPCGGKHGRGGPPLCRVPRRRGFRFASAPFLPYGGVSCGPPPHQSNVLGGGRGPGEGQPFFRRVPSSFPRFP